MFEIRNVAPPGVGQGHMFSGPGGWGGTSAEGRRWVFCLEAGQNGGALGGRFDRVAEHRWHGVMHRPVELASGHAFARTAPLLEEERHACRRALIPDRRDPVFQDGTGTMSTFTTDDHPVDAIEVERL